MFDIGFSELLVIGVVALIVIGPERLPRVARTAGHLYGRFQRYVSDVKMDINREMHLDELRKMQDELKTSVNSLEQSVHAELKQGAQAVQEVTEQIHEIIEIPHQTTATEVKPEGLPEPVSLSPGALPEVGPLPNPLPQAGEGENVKGDCFDLRDVDSLRELHVNEKKV